MLTIEHLSKTYHGGVKAVDDLSFQVNNGEIVGFIGLNGAGKTTTLKMMSGILRPDGGHVQINDYSMETSPLEAKENIGYIADSPDMFLRLRGMEYLNLIGDIYKVPVAKRKEKIESLTKRFDLFDALEEPMQSYSHGMRQKMMVTAALLHEPDVWILDEPLTGLDPKSAFALKQMMREHADAGHSVLFSTHVLEVAEKLCDRVVVIHHGRTLFIGTLEELSLRYPKMDLEQIFLTMTKDETMEPSSKEA
ncbi:MAG: ABC transporter ATP-binding protein [Lachnospiraceae bacterium]|nr:ABC transporter ATP-binding protein [Lachnospiraceae bacterium]